MKCPKCRGRTEVLETTQKADATRRRRHCIAPTCGLRFTTTETSIDAPSVKSGPNASELIARLIAPEFKGSGNYDREALAAAIAVDQRKLAIKRAQRAQAARERQAWIDTGFDSAPDSLDERNLRRELEGY
jgi:transcriptional regulator NrdR family protein